MGAPLFIATISTFFFPSCLLLTLMGGLLVGLSRLLLCVEVIFPPFLFLGSRIGGKNGNGMEIVKEGKA